VTPNARAFAFGTAAIASAIAASFVALYFQLDLGGILMWVPLLIGGFITARLATSHRLLLATALVLPGAAMFALFNWLWHAAGQGADFTGLAGAFIVVTMAIPFGTVLCLVGGVLGFLSTRRMTPNKALERTRER
jgi:hypothetical protein